MSTDNLMKDKSAGEIIETITAKLDEVDNGSKDASAIKSRAISFISALTKPLVYLRDNEGLELSVQSYVDHLELSVVEKLAFDESNSAEKEAVVKPLTAFLATLPFYDTNKAGEQSEYTNEQYGFIAMMVARALSELAPVQA